MSRQAVMKNQGNLSSLASDEDLAKAKIAAEILATSQAQKAMANYAGMKFVAHLLDLVIIETRRITLKSGSPT